MKCALPPQPQKLNVFKRVVSLGGFIKSLFGAFWSLTEEGLLHSLLLGHLEQVSVPSLSLVFVFYIIKDAMNKSYEDIILMVFFRPLIFGYWLSNIIIGPNWNNSFDHSATSGFDQRYNSNF